MNDIAVKIGSIVLAAPGRRGVVKGACIMDLPEGSVSMAASGEGVWSGSISDMRVEHSIRDVITYGKDGIWSGGHQLRNPPKELRDIEAVFEVSLKVVYVERFASVVVDKTSVKFIGLIKDGTPVHDAYTEEDLRRKPKIRRYIERAAAFYAPLEIQAYNARFDQTHVHTGAAS